MFVHYSNDISLCNKVYHSTTSVNSTVVCGVLVTNLGFEAFEEIDGIILCIEINT